VLGTTTETETSRRDGPDRTWSVGAEIVVDTHLYVEAITTDEGNVALAAFQRRCAPFLFQYSTIAQEILAGARDEAGYREFHEDWVAPFEDLGRVITPTQTAWMRADDVGTVPRTNDRRAKAR
jgi:hypothetical protein